MKVGSVAQINERKQKTILAILAITIVCGILFSILFELIIIFFIWLIKLIIEYYVYILIGVVAILIGRKILFRSKRR